MGLTCLKLKHISIQYPYYPWSNRMKVHKAYRVFETVCWWILQNIWLRNSQISNLTQIPINATVNVTTLYSSPNPPMQLIPAPPRARFSWRFLPAKNRFFLSTDAKFGSWGLVHSFVYKTTLMQNSRLRWLLSGHTIKIKLNWFIHLANIPR